MKMKLLLGIALLFSFQEIMACGAGPMEDNYYYFNVFDQENMPDQAFIPFLRVDESPFYEGEEGLPNLGNLKLWKDLLPRFSLGELNRLMDDRNLNAKEEKQLMALDHGKEIVAYLNFAKEVSQYFAYRSDYSWVYEDIRTRKNPGTKEQEAKAMKGFRSAKNKLIKQRYAYQLIRIFHYGKKHGDAVAFFEEKVKGKTPINEMYYYLLDQVAGCYYSTEDYEQAAYYFLQVFSESEDRKTSAFSSYRFCTNNDKEGKSFFKGTEDEAAYVLMKGLRDFSDGIADLERLNELQPFGKKATLLFVRQLNNLERLFLEQHFGMNEGTLPTQGARAINAANNLEAYAGKAYEASQDDFWKLSQAWLNFMLRDLAGAKNNLSMVQSKRYTKQVQIMETTFEVFTWKEMNETRGERFFELMPELKSLKSASPWDIAEAHPGYLLCVDYVSHLYYTQGDLAEAYLLQNNIEDIERISSRPLLEDLLAFAKKENKNAFDENLGKSALTGKKGKTLLDYIHFAMGHLFLQEGNPREAIPHLQASKWDKELAGEQSEFPISQKVSAWVFSNNLMECFECPQEMVMQDSVFLASVFDFIPREFSKSELAQILVDLEEMTLDSKEWKQKLAHYLLGNYYFNVSNSGYFRGTLAYGSNCCHYRFFKNVDYSSAAERIDYKEGYNLNHISEYPESDYEMASTAFDHYADVIRLSKDRELNARCLYMQAKCELNRFYNEEGEATRYRGYDGGLEGNAIDYKKSFEKLKEEYSDTRFQKMILEECSYYAYYCNN